MLQHLSTVFGKKNSIGLYRDDGLAILQNISGPEAERIRKKVIKVFKDHGLQLTIKSGLIQTDFLDINFHITSGRYWPYRKPNDQPLYINARSNHTPIIKNQFPSMLSKRLSDLSCNQEEFVKASSVYIEALRKSGYQDEILY